MEIPFEDPSKAKLRGKCMDAIDASAYALLDPSPEYPLLPHLGLQGKLKGDLASRDGKGVTYLYILRPAHDRPLPPWIVNLAVSAHATDGVELFVVVEQLSPEMEKSCRAAGAGLLVVNDDRTFTKVVDPSNVDPAIRETRLMEELKRLRDKLHAKLELNQDAIRADYARVSTLTTNFGAKRSLYLAAVEAKDTRWREWSDSIATRLDAARDAGDHGALAEIERDIERGAQESD